MVQVKRPEVTVNPHAHVGGKLYSRFLSAYDKSRDKEVKVMFHGTRAAAAVNICRKGMDPKRRLSGGDWFTVDPNYAVSRAISREEYYSSTIFGNAFPMTSAKTELAIPTGKSGRGGGKGSSGGSGGDWSTRSIRIVAAAILMDGASKIGDHIVSSNHHHALPLFVVEFKLNTGSPLCELIGK